MRSHFLMFRAFLGHQLHHHHHHYHHHQQQQRYHHRHHLVKLATLFRNNNNNNNNNTHFRLITKDRKLHQPFNGAVASNVSHINDKNDDINSCNNKDGNKVNEHIPTDGDRKYPVPDFSDTEAIYRGKSNLELLRSMFVFQLCSIDFLVDNQAKILKYTRNLLGTKLFGRLMDLTFFGQFMVRDEESRLLEGLRRQVERGISPMMAYTAPELHGSVGPSSETGDGAKEKWCADNFDNVLRSFETAKKCYEFTKKRPIITTKLTFFTDHSLLKLLSQLLTSQNAMLMSPGEKHESIDNFIRNSNKWSKRCMESLKTDLEFHLELNKRIHEDVPKVNDDVMKLDGGHLDGIQKLKDKMDKLCETAKRTDVSLNFDAEQTYLQPAIETLCVHFQRLYNKFSPIVLNTYQCYLKRTGDVIEEHVTMAKRDGFCFGGKIVRGAYIDEERRLANETKTIDPVNPSYEATTSMYERVSEYLLNEVKVQGEGRMRVIFATHNQDSVVDVINRLRNKRINVTSGDVSFAQLYGTRDFISYTLGSLGYPVSKMTHYSNPIDGLAYLSRRLVENRSGLPSPEIERKLPVIELKRRLLRKNK